MKAILFSQQRGFTLLELLLAMTLGALIMAGIGSFLSQSFSLAKGQEDTARALAAGSRLSMQLARSLRSALLKEGRDDLFFLAADEGPTLLFTTEKGGEVKLVGWGVFEGEIYYLQKLPGEITFFEGELPSPALFQDWGAERISSVLEEVTLRYFDGESWHASWDSRTAALPELVELSFVSSASSRRQVQLIGLPCGGGRQ